MLSRCSMGLGMTRGRGIPCDRPRSAVRGERRAPPGWCARAGRRHRILETRDWILTEGCGRVSASPEHNAVAARHRLWVNYRYWSKKSKQFACPLIEQ